MSDTRYYLEIVAASDDAIDTAMIQRLRARGFTVSHPLQWERLGDFAEGIGISIKTLVLKLDDPRCPPVEVQRTRGTQGRRSHLKPTKAFEDFCLENKQ